MGTRMKRITLLPDLISNYWIFYVYAPVILRSGKLSVQAQNTAKTCVDIAGFVKAYCKIL